MHFKCEGLLQRHHFNLRGAGGLIKNFESKILKKKVWKFYFQKIVYKEKQKTYSDEIA